MMNCKILGISALLALTIFGQAADAQIGRRKGNNFNNHTPAYSGVNNNPFRVRLRSNRSGWGDASPYFVTPFRTVYKPYTLGNNYAPLRWRLHGCGSLGWWSSLPTYGSAFYQAVYPGINLTYYGSPVQPGYQFIVTPGADPYQIVFLYDGLDNCYLNGHGDLILRTAGGQIIHRQPSLYQEINGVRIPVAGNYVLRGNGRVGLEVGSYNTGYPLFITRR
jgi:hypothetical protein